VSVRDLILLGVVAIIATAPIAYVAAFRLGLI
jgi:hypothetical protein